MAYGFPRSEPTSEELLIYFVQIVGLERLEPVLAFMDPVEALEVRRAALLPLPPQRAHAVRARLHSRISVMSERPKGSALTVRQMFDRLL